MNKNVDMRQHKPEERRAGGLQNAGSPVKEASSIPLTGMHQNTEKKAT
jgi:hypothetical protein